MFRSLRHIEVTLTTYVLCLQAVMSSLHLTVFPAYGAELLHLV